MKVLHIESDLGNQVFIENILSKIDIRSVCAKNDEEAIAILKVKGHEFSFILSDMRGLTCEGYDAPNEFKKYTNAPVIALTGHAFMEHKKKCLELGCIEYLSKPFKEKSFYDVLIMSEEKHLDQNMQK